MKVPILILLHTFLSFQVSAQSDSLLIDSRDNQTYRTININGSVWMLENLELKTNLSFGLPDTLKVLNPDFRGRWYHMNEIDTICPEGWRLPSVNDWIGYFDYLSSSSGGEYELKTWKDTYNITEFNQYFDLFEDGNPLEIVGAGIYQGDRFIYAPNSADYWIMDLETRKEGKKRDFKLVKKSFPSTAHIHLFNKFTNIHSHEFNLNPAKPAELRRFLCRCVKK